MRTTTDVEKESPVVPDLLTELWLWRAYSDLKDKDHEAAKLAYMRAKHLMDVNKGRYPAAVGS